MKVKKDICNIKDKIKKEIVDSFSINNKIIIIFFIGFLSLLIKSMIFSQPYIFGDELSYKTMATGFFNYGNFYHFSSEEIGPVMNIPNILYQFIISVSFYFDNNFYIVIKILNSLFVSAIIFPIYFLLKSFNVKINTAVLILFALFFLPELNYVVNIMPENLYLFIFITSFYMSYIALTKITITSAITSSFSTVLLYLTKPHAIAFILSFYIVIIILIIAKYINLNKKLVLFCLAHFLSFTIIYIFISYLLNINVGLGFYAKPLTNFKESIDFLKLGNLFLGHLFSILLIYGLPIVSIIIILIKHKNYDKNLVILNLFAFIVSSILFIMVIKFSNDISIYEHYDRLHGRYYYMIFPIFITLFSINLHKLKLSSAFWTILFISFIIGFFIIFSYEPFKFNISYISDNISLSWLILFHDKLIYLIIIFIISIILIYSNIKYYFLLYIFFGLITNYSFFTATKRLHHKDAIIANMKTELAKNYLNNNKDAILIGPNPSARMNTAFWFPDTFLYSISLKENTIISYEQIPSNVRKLILFGNYVINNNLVLKREINCNINFEDICIEIVYLKNSVEEIFFNKEINFDRIEKILGLADKENFGRWTDSELSHSTTISFKTKLPKNFRLELVSGTLEQNIGSIVRIKIGERIKEFTLLDSNKNKYILEFENIDDAYSIEIIPSKSTSPNGNDKRKLGLSLISLQIFEEIK